LSTSGNDAADAAVIRLEFLPASISFYPAVPAQTFIQSGIYHDCVRSMAFPQTNSVSAAQRISGCILVFLARNLRTRQGTEKNLRFASAAPQLF
jgi:hypothetical protein